jgi:hypothetical protein
LIGDLQAAIRKLGPEGLEHLAARASPASLARYLTGKLAPEVRYEITPHVRLISDVARKAALGVPGFERVAVLAPPRHGKSQTLSRWLPTWFLEEFPQRKVMLGTYAADFARDWGRAVRDNFESYHGILSTRLREDSRAADRWNTQAGGGMITGGVGGSFTGRGFHLGIVDDPFKNYQEAMSKAVRDNVWNWWRSTFLTRAEPGASIVVTLTRWHVDDLLGRILAEPDGHRWRIIRMPALAEGADILGRPQGEALWPERYDKAALRAASVAVGPYVWDALYQQNPPDLAGLLTYYAFRAEWNKTTNAFLVPGYNLQLAIDFNRRPGMFAVLGQHFRQNDLLTARRVIHAPGMTIKQLVGRPSPGSPKAQPLSFLEYAKEIGAVDASLKWTGKFPRLEVFGDATGRRTQESDGASNWDFVFRELAAAGIPADKRVPKNNPGERDRVNSVNAAFLGADGKVRYIIHPEAAPLVRDYETVKDDGDEIDKSESDSGFTHASDADGYRVHYLMPIRGAHQTGGRIGHGGQRQASSPIRAR